MKSKITSLVLIGGAILIAAFTQDSVQPLAVTSHYFLALALFAWFTLMSIGLYFWAKHTRQETSQQQTPPQTDNSLSLQQLARAVGPSGVNPVAETSATTDQVQEPVSPSRT